MTPNPLFNAAAAFAYILVLVLCFFTGIDYIEHRLPEEIAPILVLSLLVFSVAYMAYVFFATPLRFLIEGKWKDGFHLLVQTLGFFGAFIVLFICLAFFSF